MHVKLRRGYWKEVHRILEANHNLDGSKAVIAVHYYRTALRKARLGNEVYRHSVSKTVNGILGVFEQLCKSKIVSRN